MASRDPKDPGKFPFKENHEDDDENERKPPALPDWSVVPAQTSRVARDHNPHHHLWSDKVQHTRRSSQSGRVWESTLPYSLTTAPSVARRPSHQELLSQPGLNMAQIPPTRPRQSQNNTLDDKTLRAQQIDILQQIQKENQMKKKAPRQHQPKRRSKRGSRSAARQSHLADAATSKKAASNRRSLFQPSRKNVSQEVDWNPPRFQQPPSSNKSDETSTRVPGTILVPQKATPPRFRKHGIVEVYPDVFVNVHSTRRAWEAVAKGTATIVQCCVCGKRFQLSKQAQVLYCTSCGSLTPVEVGTESSGGNDYRMALRMQRQEIDVELDRERETRRRRPQGGQDDDASTDTEAVFRQVQRDKSSGSG